MSSRFLINDDTFAMNQAKARVDKAVTTFEAEKKRLYRQDGTAKYAPNEHNERLAELLEPVKQAVVEAQEYSQRAQEAAKKLEALQHADPLSALTTEELTRLNAARELAKDEIAQLLPGQLSARLTAVAGSGDKVSQLLHLLYAKPLVQASDDSALHNKLAAIDEAVNGKQRAAAASALEEARKLRKGAGELSFYASNTLGEVNGSTAASLEQRASEYASYF